MKRVLLIACGLVAGAVLIWHPPSATPAIAVATTAPAQRHTKRIAPSPGSPAIVYVAGAVRRPGLYRVPAAARADDGVRLAGGFRADADRGAINLAARVADGEEIFVPALGQPTARPARRQNGARRSTKKIPTAVYDVNRASAAELTTVPGIGRVLAARIVEMRERDGAFANYDELLDVAGMTPARLERAEPYLQI